MLHQEKHTERGTQAGKLAGLRVARFSKVETLK